MTPAEREQAISSLRDSRDRLLRTAHGLSPAQLRYKPAPDRWSVAECIEHIVLVESSILGGVEKTLQQAADSPKSAIQDDVLVHQVVDRTTRVKGPDRLMPMGRWPHDQLLREFEAARKRTSEFAATTNADLRQAASRIRRSARSIATSGCFSSPRMANAIAPKPKKSWPTRISRAQPPQSKISSVQGTSVGTVILSGASRRFILSRRSFLSISGSGRAVEESLFGVTKQRGCQQGPARSPAWLVVLTLFLSARTVAHSFAIMENTLTI